jgi:hypothetical protein
MHFIILYWLVQIIYIYMCLDVSPSFHCECLSIKVCSQSNCICSAAGELSECMYLTCPGFIVVGCRLVIFECLNNVGYSKEINLQLIVTPHKSGMLALLLAACIVSENREHVACSKTSRLNEAFREIKLNFRFTLGYKTPYGDLIIFGKPIFSLELSVVFFSVISNR